MTGVQTCALPISGDEGIGPRPVGAVGRVARPVREEREREEADGRAVAGIAGGDADVCGYARTFAGTRTATAIDLGGTTTTA